MNTLARLFGLWVHEVDARTLRADALAGLLGAVLVLPQAIAFAALAGLPPSYALATAVLPCIVAALFGSSRHVMSGPTNWGWNFARSTISFVAYPPTIQESGSARRDLYALSPIFRYMKICCCAGSPTPDCGRLKVFSIFLRQCRSS